ncbi:MAG: SGNH/GDSL hydrolase family protein [Elusimicrobia bacterium]|nr:SGNH/GDSL hydrolase family protein [Candidatus Liberimonas magnetica]
MNIYKYRLLKSISLCILSLIFSCLAAEIIFRLFFLNKFPSISQQKTDDKTLIAEFTKPSPYPKMVYKLKPGINIEWKGVRIATSKHGRRRISSNNIKIKNPDFRIAVLGDSSPFGWGVEYNQTYAELLRIMLEKHYNKKIELGNFSVPGYNCQHNRAAFEKFVLPWGPDLVILHYDHNDPEPIDTKPPNYISPEYGNNILGSMILKLLIQKWRLHQVKKMTTFMESDPTNPDKAYSYYYYSGKTYDTQLNELKALAENAKLHNIPVIAFVFNPWIKRYSNFMDDPLYTLFHQPIVKKLSDYGYYVIDSYPVYQEIMEKNGWEDISAFWLSQDDAHPNKDGHAFIAETIVRYMIDRCQIGAKHDLCDLLCSKG